MLYFSASTSPGRSRRFGCMAAALGCVAVVLLVVAVVMWMARSAPSEWNEIHEMIAQVPPQERIQIADALESRLGREAQGLAPEGTGSAVAAPPPPTDFRSMQQQVIERNISIPMRDANIWLATKLPAWMANQKAELPAGVSDPRVWVQDGELVMSLRLSLAGYSGVMSMGVTAEMRPDGKMLVTAKRARAGRLPISRGIIADELKAELEKAESQATRQLADVFEGMVFDPVWPEPGNERARQVRILDFQLHADRIDLKVRNGPKEK